MNTFTLGLIFFLIMDPVGNTPPVIEMMQGIEKKRRKWIILREMTIALFIIVLFSFIGEWLFDFLQISDVAVKLSSGMIMFLFALRVIFPDMGSIRSQITPQEPFITPLAIPLIAGPALLATVMLYAKLTPTITQMLIAIFGAWIAATFVLLIGEQLKKVLKTNGLFACEKLMGMIIILLAIQRFLDGIEEFILSR